MTTHTSHTRLRQEPASARPLHKYVAFGVGIWVLFIVTFVMAHFRVSQNEKYDGLPLKSLSKEQPQKTIDSYKK